MSSFHRPSEAVVPVTPGRDGRPVVLRSVILGLALLFSLAIFYAPSFLLICEAPVRSDTVVLFIGGEKGAREKEADQLIREGFADYLIVPGTGQIKKRGPDGRLFRMDADLKLETSSLKPRPQDELLNPSLLRLKTATRLENTHIEILETKRLMDDLGLRSALFISSPYHMRRIKIVTGKVFQDQMTVSYMPTRYESFGKGFWLFNSSERNFVLTEYAKIVWFLLYSSFL